jgi:hypothetical protein
MDIHFPNLSIKAVVPIFVYCFGLWLQIFLDDVKVEEQLIDMVFFMLTYLGGYRQVFLNSSLYMLICVVNPYWALHVCCRNTMLLVMRTFCIQLL